MEKDPILERTKALIADLPTTKMHPVSRELLHEDPIDWVVSRTRLLRAALLNGDQEALDRVVDDMAHLVGKREAELWKIDEMGKIVDQELNFLGNDGQMMNNVDLFD